MQTYSYQVRYFHMYIGYIKFIGSTSISTLIFLKFFIFSIVSLSNFWGLIFVEYLIKILDLKLDFILLIGADTGP